MHSVQSYCERTPSDILLGGLRMYILGTTNYMEESLTLILDTLRKRGDLDPELAEAVASRLEKERNRQEPEASE